MAYENTKQILLVPEQSLQLGAKLTKPLDAHADSEGKIIMKAGTPVGGDTSFLTDETAVLTTQTDAKKLQGIVLHDVDVTTDTASAVVAKGVVNLATLDSDVQKLYTTDVINQLETLNILVVKRNLGTN